MKNAKASIYCFVLRSVVSKWTNEGDETCHGRLERVDEEVQVGDSAGN